jgi:magnesium and cobalt transporter
VRRPDRRDGDAESDPQRRTLFDWLSGLFSDEPESREDLLDVLRDAADRQLMDVDALNTIFGALQVAEMHARDIMIPRSQLVSIDHDMTLDEILDVVIESQHSRYPVFGEELDDVKGILHAKDLLNALRGGFPPDFDMKDVMRVAKIVPESKRLNVLLQEFRSNRNHMAVIVDEYGHVSGAVTIEDVLEQIVGEIEDEHDVDDEGWVKRLSRHVFNVKATAAVEDFNEFFGVDLPDTEFDTIGGIVLKAFGHVPERGERVEVADLKIEVLSADTRRLRLLRVDTSP